MSGLHSPQHCTWHLWLRISSVLQTNNMVSRFMHAVLCIYNADTTYSTLYNQKSLLMYLSIFRSLHNDRACIFLLRFNVLKIVVEWHQGTKQLNSLEEHSSSLMPWRMTGDIIWRWIRQMVRIHRWQFWHWSWPLSLVDSGFTKITPVWALHAKFVFHTAIEKGLGFATRIEAHIPTWFIQAHCQISEFLRTRTLHRLEEFHRTGSNHLPFLETFSRILLLYTA